MTPSPTRRPRRRADRGGAGARRRPPGERYYRHPGDVVRLVVWGVATVVLLLFIAVATGTSDGVRTDLGGAATAFPRAARELAAGRGPGRRRRSSPVAVVGGARRGSSGGGGWRRSSAPPPSAPRVWVAARRCCSTTRRAIAGALDDEAVAGLDPVPVARRTSPAASPSSPSASRGCPGRGGGRSTVRRRARRSTHGRRRHAPAAPELLLAVAAGGLAGAAVLVAFGAPNRRPTPAAVRRRPRRGRRRASQRLELRAGRRRPVPALPGVDARTGPRSSRSTARTAATPTCSTAAYRNAGRCASRATTGRRRRWPATSSTRRCCCCWPSGPASPAPSCGPSSRCPTARWCWRWRTSAGAASTRWRPTSIDAELLDAVCGARSSRSTAAGLAHRALRAANVLVGDDGRRRSLIDLGAAPAAPSAAAAGHRPGRAARLARPRSSGPSPPSRRRRGSSIPTTWPRRCPTCSRWRCRRRPAAASRRRRSRDAARPASPRRPAASRRRSSG